ncbi:hypothetical protein [Delftia acidovorans]|uniref:hypothetical protein n=1 Tax=Delftia acidovorans TaxID=80866 RepID=UPI0012D2D98E|nr:hypothetical protein [Delftia acidovorans]QQB53031.1 hypothetical protein I6H54_12515 [Delftia acidovorans]
MTAGATDVEAVVLGAAILVSFRPPRDYWVELAVQWAEFGSPMTDESVDERSKCAIENMEVENLIEKMAKDAYFRQFLEYESNKSAMNDLPRRAGHG